MTDLIKDFENNYPQTDKHNRRTYAIQRIIELEAKEELSFDERTELFGLRRTVKRLKR